MNRKKIQFIALIIALLSVFPSITRAQQETYNYKQALQSLQNKDTQAAIAYIYKDLANNPKNSKAWMLMSGAYGMLNNADSALFAIDNAIKFAPKTNENMLQGQSRISPGNGLHRTTAQNPQPRSEAASQEYRHAQAKRRIL